MKKSPKRKSGTIQDARGENRPVISVNDLFRDPRMGDPRFAAAIEKTVRLKLVDLRVGVGMAIAVAVAFALAAALFMLRGKLGFTVPPYVGGAIPGVVSVSITLWLLHRSEKRRAPEVARVLLADALCPSCSYGLAELPPEHDGCTVCPECGSAWSADRIARHTHYKEFPNDMPRARGLALLWHDGIGTGTHRIVDDAGIERPLVSPKLRREINAAHGDRKSRLAAAAKRNRRCGMFARVPIAAIYIGLGIAGPWLVFHFVPNRSATLIAIPVAALCLAFGACVLRGSIGVTGPWVKREMLLKGLCPSCAADLPVEPRTLESPIPPAPATVIAARPTPAPSPQESATCPECQARWTSPALAMWRASTPSKPA